jgi:hypothetical protein
MTRNRWQPKRRFSSETARKMGIASQKAQAARRIALLTADDLVDAMAIPRPGDAVGCLQYHDFRTGRVRRWTVLRGDRLDRVVLRSPDGRKTRSHGWTWIMNHLRGFLAGRKA